MKSKNQRLLDSFTKYCEESPDERFWQALRNWARLEVDGRINYIFAGRLDGKADDTFHWEDVARPDKEQLTIPFAEK